MENNCAFLIHVSKGNGGHISCNGGKSSLCGIEKRLHNNDFESDFHESEFPTWLNNNKSFVCRSCLKTFESRNPKIKPVERKAKV